MECLDCGAQMAQQSYEGVVVDRCATCGGTWLDWGELGWIVDTQEQTFGDEEVARVLSETSRRRESVVNQPERNCPKCGRRLHSLEYAANSGVIVDRCPGKCGLWLDRNELEQVQIVMEELDGATPKRHAPAAGGPAPAAARCPGCNGQMTALSYEGVPLDRCESCSGVWCDGDELHMVIQRQVQVFSEADFTDIRASEDAAVVKPVRTMGDNRQCPVCGAGLAEMNYQYTSGILLDRCPRGHGIWLDAQELSRAQVFAERWGQVQGLAAKYQRVLSAGPRLALGGVPRPAPVSPAAHRARQVSRFFRLVSLRPFAP